MATPDNQRDRIAAHDITATSAFNGRQCRTVTLLSEASGVNIKMQL